MKQVFKKGVGLLAPLAALSLGVASASAQTATPAADTAAVAQTGGWLGLPWWLWAVLGLLLFVPVVVAVSAPPPRAAAPARAAIPRHHDPTRPPGHAGADAL